MQAMSVDCQEMLCWTRFTVANNALTSRLLAPDSPLLMFLFSKVAPVLLLVLSRLLTMTNPIIVAVAA